VQERRSLGKEKQKLGIYLWCADSEEKLFQTKEHEDEPKEATKRKENPILIKSGGTNLSHRIGRSGDRMEKSFWSDVAPVSVRESTNNFEITLVAGRVEAPPHARTATNLKELRINVTWTVFSIIYSCYNMHIRKLNYIRKRHSLKVKHPHTYI
jgi:hypothetical protein